MLKHLRKPLRKWAFLCLILMFCFGWEVGEKPHPRRYYVIGLRDRIDLNYRIDLSSQSIRTLLTWPGPAEANLAELRKYDQVSLVSG